ncbi:hypothetical protein AYWB_186 [Aster yellows witches'-broom phytoplasma AYWB]|uniref:Uncharacterized protein n=1 Tax=Aster yellows witches'-broom phytoplasma (strain AYWB) TaxID=322098 RepID=Q2NJU0_AYWBP|nr:hypothetical protein [Aster yellows witches'-broom phytoplasma]ABC65303.1 hypothetical protein AYWB_186 [Aster yellows witches'-broom phytoplasma AYWB]
MKQQAKQKAIFPFILMLFSIIIILGICYYNINSNINKVDAFLTDFQKETKQDFKDINKNLNQTQTELINKINNENKEIMNKLNEINKESE